MVIEKLTFLQIFYLPIGHPITEIKRSIHYAKITLNPYDIVVFVIQVICRVVSLLLRRNCYMSWMARRYSYLPA